MGRKTFVTLSLAIALGTVAGPAHSEDPALSDRLQCLDRASMRPTNNGVRLAVQVCWQRFPAPKPKNSDQVIGRDKSSRPITARDICVAAEGARAAGNTDDVRRLEEFIASRSIECED